MKRDIKSPIDYDVSLDARDFVTMSRKVLIITCILGLWLAGAAAQVEERTIIDYERGLQWTGPWMTDYSQLGLYHGSMYTPADDRHNKKWSLVPPEALKIPGLVYLQHVWVDEPGYLFPLPELLAFERDEVRQGRAPFFVTATYDGKKRPVLKKLNLPGGLAAEIYGSSEVQAVNVGDDRYVKFWVKNFVRRITAPFENLWNWGIQLDNSGYRLNYYVVVDDEGQRHRVQWDEPFPQTDEEWADAGKWAIHRVKELAPDLVLGHNAFRTALTDETRYGDVFGAIDMTLPEGFGYDGIYSSSKQRDHGWQKHVRILPPDGPDAYKIQVLSGSGIADHYQMQQMFLAYIIWSGPNAFFGPHSSDSTNEIPPDWYAGMKNMLGSPIEHPESIQEVGKGLGHRMYSRRCEGGIVYLNLSGTTKQITLPNDSSYYDQDGRPVSEVILDDCMSTYVTTDPWERMAKPRINPRRPGLVTGPLTITLEAGPFSPVGVARIFYTLDGTEPDEHSTVYTDPFEIYESCVVKARAFDARLTRELRLPSFTNFATYTLTDEEPTVEFHLTGDSGSEFLEHDYPVVSLSHVSAHPVTITYGSIGGTAIRASGVRVRGDYELEPGTLTIRPGEQHRCFYVHIVNDEEAEPDETIMISISNPTNATLGDNTIYTYTIEDNDREPIVEVEDSREGFETGDFRLAWHEYSGWVITSKETNSGLYSAQCSAVSPNDSYMGILLKCRAGKITFYRKLVSHPNKAGLKFNIDGVDVGQWSGELDWEKVSFPVTEGTHTFRWHYYRTPKSTRDEDFSWIDDIEFPIDSGDTEEPTITEPNSEGFETGDFSSVNWELSGDVNWFVTSEERNSGTYSARAGSIEDDKRSTLRVELDCTSGDISFYCKVSSEQEFDFLEFYIDGLRQDKWTGIKDWVQVSFPVEEGARTFKWIYSKDSSISRGSDTAWIDDIVFPIN